nr:hypothetical protein [Deltaproteobacteria bacterium]
TPIDQVTVGPVALTFRQASAGFTCTAIVGGKRYDLSAPGSMPARERIGIQTIRFDVALDNFAEIVTAP